jgi:hypothetical protein
MNLRRIFWLMTGCGLLIAVKLPAQGYQTVTGPDTAVRVMADPRLEDLIRRQKNLNQLHPTMPGFRIQIYFGGARQKASEIRQEFTDRHADVPAYVLYQQPNFKVRIGDFRTRLEAQKMLKSMEGEYLSMFIVPDDVNLPPLK